MPPSAGDFFVKEGYRANPSAKSLDTEPADQYWTAERIERSFRYQHHVYAMAARIAARNGYRTGLDLGCGPGTKAARILNRALTKVILIDQPSSAVMARKSLPDATFIGVDLEACDIELDGQLDLIVCADVLEHLADPLPCIRFARNHLKAAGTAIFSTPERDVLRGPDCMTSPHPAHVREWNSAEFRALLQHGGFQVESQVTLPIARLAPMEELARLLLNRFLRLPRWHSCQATVCIRQS